MENVKRYGRLYRVFITQFFKTLMQSKVDFWVGLIGFFFSQMTGIAFLYLVFQQIPALNGWSFYQLLFIYGFAQIPRGLDHLFTDNIWMVAWRMVVTGQFDRYMLRPMNLFFQVICEKLQPDALGELAVGIILVVISVHNGVVSFTFVSFLVFVLSVLAGSIIYTSIKLFFAATAFWIKVSVPFLQVAYELADFAKYPVEIYNRSIRFIITWVIPFAFVAYYPASYFLLGSSFLKTVGAECILAIVLWIIAYGLFKKGTLRYESAGS
jgi:ABC-2 type transport system permease protein